MLLWAHITSGALALLCGALALVFKKGSVAHRRSGQVFFVSMLLCGTSALWMAIRTHHAFLLVIGVFSLYLTLAGFNALRVLKSDSARKFGHGLSAVMALGIAAFLYIAVRSLQQGNPAGATVLLVFAAVAGFLVWQDHTVLRSRTPQGPITLHIGRMVGAWISAFTAFLVVNGTMQPPILNWLLPTVIGVPVIVFWIGKKTAGSPRHR